MCSSNKLLITNILKAVMFLVMLFFSVSSYAIRGGKINECMAIKDLSDKAVESVDEDIRKDPNAGIPSSTEGEVIAAQEENKSTLQSEAQMLAFKKATQCVELFLERCNSYQEKYKIQCKNKRKEQLDVVASVREKANNKKKEVESGQFKGDIATIQQEYIQELKAAQEKLVGIRETCTSIREEMRPYCPKKVKGKIEAGEAPIVSKLVEGVAVSFDDNGEGQPSDVVVSSKLQNDVVTSIPTAGLSGKIDEVDADNDTYFGSRSMGVADSTVLNAEQAVAGIVARRDIDQDCGGSANFFGSSSSNLCPPDSDPDPVPIPEPKPKRDPVVVDPVNPVPKPPIAKKEEPFVDPINAGPAGKSTELGGTTEGSNTDSSALSKTGSTSGGFLSNLGSMFSGGAIPATDYSTNSSYDDGSYSNSYYKDNQNLSNNQYDNNYGNANGRYNNQNNSAGNLPNQNMNQRMYDSNGNYIGNGQGNNNTGFGQFGNNGNSSTNGAKNKTTDKNKNGNKQVFSSRNVSSGGVSNGIFGASKKDQKFQRQMASLKSKDAVFDPNKYNPSMKAQAQAMARGTGRSTGGNIKTPSCENIMGKTKTLPGVCDIRTHVKGSDVFSNVSPSYKINLRDI